MRNTIYRFFKEPSSSFVTATTPAGNNNLPFQSRPTLIFRGEPAKKESDGLVSLRSSQIIQNTFGGLYPHKEQAKMHFMEKPTDSPKIVTAYTEGGIVGTSHPGIALGYACAAATNGVLYL